MTTPIELSAKETVGLAERLTQQQTSLSLKNNGNALDLMAEALCVPTENAGVETYVNGVVDTYTHTPETLDAVLTQAVKDEATSAMDFIDHLRSNVIPIHAVITEAVDKAGQPKSLMDDIIVKWWSPISPNIPIESTIVYDKEPPAKPLLRSLPLDHSKASQDFAQGRLLTEEMIEALLKESDVRIEDVHKAFFGMNPRPDAISTRDFTPITRLAVNMIVMNLCEYYHRNVQVTKGIGITAEDYDERLNEFERWAENDMYFQLEMLKLSRQAKSVILGFAYEGDKRVIYLDRYFAETFTEQVGDVRVIMGACLNEDYEFTNAYSSLPLLINNKETLLRHWTLYEEKNKQAELKNASNLRRYALQNIVEGYGAKHGLSEEMAKQATCPNKDTDTVLYSAECQGEDINEAIDIIVGRVIFNCPATEAFLRKFSTLPRVASTQAVDELTLRILQCFISTYVELVMTRSVVREGFQPVTV